MSGSDPHRPALPTVGPLADGSSGDRLARQTVSCPNDPRPDSPNRGCSVACNACNSTGQVPKYPTLLERCPICAEYQGDKDDGWASGCRDCHGSGYMVTATTEKLVQLLLEKISTNRGAHIGIDLTDQGYLITGQNGISIVASGYCDTLDEALASAILATKGE